MMAENPQKNTGNTRKKGFSYPAKPYGNTALGLYILDVLLSASAPLTVWQIQRAVRELRKYTYSHQAIARHIYALQHYSQSYEVTQTTVRARDNRNRAAAYSISPKKIQQ
jgi:hypothetical protein